MSRVLASYGGILLVMVLLDALWLGVLARPTYQAGIGHLMADKPLLPVAVIFYAVYALGLLIFCVLPFETEAGWRKPLLQAAMFGFFAYATYDLTNLATRKSWPWTLAVLDMAWGVLISTVSVAAGRWAWLNIGA